LGNAVIAAHSGALREARFSSRIVSAYKLNHVP
jgi:hypothetical protein